MRWKSRWTDGLGPHNHTRLGVVALSATLALSTGCQHYYGNPFRDAYGQIPETTTASSEKLAQSEGSPTARQRGHAQISTGLAAGAVVHGPLWFEDGILLAASDDQQFRWTGQDYLGILYGDARFLLNAMALPVSAVVYPPHSAACSSGEGLSITCACRRCCK